jgi:hypothetical protein
MSKLFADENGADGASKRGGNETARRGRDSNMLFHQRNKEVVAARTQWAAKDERGAVSGAGSIISLRLRLRSAHPPARSGFGEMQYR